MVEKTVYLISQMSTINPKMTNNYMTESEMYRLSFLQKILIHLFTTYKLTEDVPWK